MNPYHTLMWGGLGQSIVETVPVPDGKIHHVQTAGGFTTCGHVAQTYAVEHVIPVPGGVHRCVAKVGNPIAQTPCVAVDHTFTIYAGHRLALRTSNLPSMCQMGIIYFAIEEDILTGETQLVQATVADGIPRQDDTPVKVGFFRKWYDRMRSMRLLG